MKCRWKICSQSLNYLFAGLGDVVTEYPQYVIFNMILTMIGLSVVGLCLAIVQVIFHSFNFWGGIKL